MTNFYFYKNDNRLGPCTSAQIRALAQKGEILINTIVETEDGRRCMAGDVQGLSFPVTPNTSEPSVASQPPAPSLPVGIPVMPSQNSNPLNYEESTVPKSFSKRKATNFISRFFQFSCKPTSSEVFYRCAFRANIISWIMFISSFLYSAGIFMNLIHDSCLCLNAELEFERDLYIAAVEFDIMIFLASLFVFLVIITVFPAIVEFLKLGGKFYEYLDSQK